MAAFPSHFRIILTALLAIFLSLPSSSSSSSSPINSTAFIRLKCNSTDYPTLCIASLSSYAHTIHDSPLKLANAALNVSLDGARSASAMMARLGGVGGGPQRRDAGALRDCAETLADSVTYLRHSLTEMGEWMRGEPREVLERMDDVRTWVSAALTDESTCMDGFGGGGSLKSEVRGRVLRVAQLTSNALALIADLITTTQSP